MPVPVQLGHPAGLDDGGGVGLGDDGGAVDPVAGQKGLAVEYGRPVPDPARIRAHHVQRFERRDTGYGRDFGILHRVGGADGLHRDQLDHVAAPRHDETETPPVSLRESGLHAGALGEIDDQGGVGAVVAQVHLAQHRDVVALHALVEDLGAGVGLQGPQFGRQLGGEAGFQPCLDAALAHGAHVGEPHAVRRKHPGVGMDEDPVHGQRVGDHAGVLAAGAAEAVQRVLGDVVAPLHGDVLDRIGHVLHGDPQESLRHLLRRARFPGGGGDLPGQGVEAQAHLRVVEGLIGVGAEDPGKEARLDLAQHDVAIGDRERPAAPVTRRPGVGARRIRPHPHAGAVEMQDGAAAGRHRVDVHHGCAQAYPADQGFEGPLECAVVMGDVGRRAAHVEPDDLREPGHGRRPGHADDAAGGAGQDAVLALEQARVGEPAVGLHEHDPGFAQRRGDAVHVAPEDGRQIGIDHRGVAARDQLHQRRDLVRR